MASPPAQGCFQFRAEAVVRSLIDIDQRESIAAEADFVFTVSGTGVLRDDALGMHINEKSYDDMKLDDIETLALSRPLRLVGVIVTNANEECYVQMYVVPPSATISIAQNGLTATKIRDELSIQTPRLILASLECGQGGIWQTYASLCSTLSVQIQWEHRMGARNVISADGHTVCDSCDEITRVLPELRRGNPTEPTPFTQNEYEAHFGSLEGTLDRIEARKDNCRLPSEHSP
ncbi:hypothetical protein DFH11DRAFT_1543614 [Phellopilus nigrolimitatus]|nr:hypothetical protein DFH11DRAFT_1543614 [Phellopilus nigrolimitatus]